MHDLVSEATPYHHVLCTNLRHRVGVNTVLDLPSRRAVHRSPDRDPPNPGPLGTQGVRLADYPLACEMVLVRGGNWSTACCRLAHGGAQRRPRGERSFAGLLRLDYHRPYDLRFSPGQPRRWGAGRGAGLAWVRPAWAAGVRLLAADLDPDPGRACDRLARSPPVPGRWPLAAVDNRGLPPWDDGGDVLVHVALQPHRRQRAHDAHLPRRPRDHHHRRVVVGGR